MSKKRYNSRQKGGSPHYGAQYSTSPQSANYEDSLVTECLICTFMEKGKMENPILKSLFIGGTRPKERGFHVKKAEELFGWKRRARTLDQRNSLR